MTQREIQETIINATARVINEANGWNDSEKKLSWDEKVNNVIVNAINAGTVQDLIRRVKAAKDVQGITKTLSTIYIGAVATLLNIASGDGKIEPIHSDLENEYAADVAAALDKYDNTVVGYHALELAGSKEKLEQVLSKTYGSPVQVTVRHLDEPDVIYRTEKVRYADHAPWITTQLMPILLVEKA